MYEEAKVIYELATYSSERVTCRKAYGGANEIETVMDFFYICLWARGLNTISPSFSSPRFQSILFMFFGI